MAECERLLRASGEMSAEAGKIRSLLAETTREVEKHLIRLPGLAQEEARRVRQMMATETEQMLDLSARTMSTLHARSTGKVTAPDHGRADEAGGGSRRRRPEGPGAQADHAQSRREKRRAAARPGK